ncbi:PorP/SprF family type IX secretion system membrane protein [Maribacter algicola]|uniref:PorP/SprF family type IX secretion system membrane protein n=1 Tax=Meishania litoralis TaxID=3434685 RepID=A0ACC7LKD4_9FLAO
MILFFGLTGAYTVHGQEDNTDLDTKGAYHNQLFFNRFLINPTFSLVRENKSYINILHRNQYATFEDNSQNYFLGFSNKLNERTALGISVYSQWLGVVQEFGFNANYATSVQLGSNSKLSFGTNVTYFNEGLDKNRVIANEGDQEINTARKESKLAIQPGITLSLGNFDFGLYAKELLKYNQTTNDFLTSLNDKSIKASLQYTHYFTAQRGLFTDARLMPLVQLGKNPDGSVDYMGSILLDLPKYGWLQSNIDDTYGISMGFGVNLNKRMSLGYLMEKDIKKENSDLGWNHEVSLAYTFQDRNAEFGVLAENSVDNKIDGIVRNYEEQILKLTSENKKLAENNNRSSSKRLESRKKNRSNKEVSPVISVAEDASGSIAHENRLILDELILRQDSVESALTAAFEKRFETIVRLLRNDLKQSIDTKSNKSNAFKHTVMVAETKPERAKAESTKKNDKFLDLPIKVLDQSQIVGVPSGYYVIANVYKTKKYLTAFMDDLRKQGLNAKQFYNKENGLYYVYLADFNAKEDARIASVTDLNGKYHDEKWIMEVSDNTAIVNNTYLD